VLATTDGVFEPFHPLGTKVSAGQPAGRIHRLGDPSRLPETLHYSADGIVYGRRQPGRVVVGNCCVTVAAPYEGEIG
jgi:predicted deacylase